MIISNRIFSILIIMLLAAFILGPYLLESQGIQYVSEGGVPLLKIHVYSYIIMLIVMVFLLRWGPSKYLHLLGRFKSAWLVSFICVTFVIVLGLYKQGTSGMAYLVDLIFTPLLLVPVLFALNPNQKEILLKILAYLILTNACIAVYEFIAQRAVIVSDLRYYSYFRSSALLAHPLNNALITASLTMLLMNKTFLPSIAYYFIVMLALFSFGGRSATAGFVIFTLLLIISGFFSFISSGFKVSKFSFALYQMVFFITLIATIYILLMTPIADRILSKLYVDTSAQARFDVFIIVDQLSLSDWFFGPGEEITNNLEHFIGINVIENYLIGWLINFGLIGAVPLLVSVYALPVKIASVSGLKTKLSVCILFLVSISNNALETKTIAVLLFFIALVCLLGKKYETV